MLAAELPVGASTFAQTIYLRLRGERPMNSAL
jgi:hypothetical protein